VKRAAAFTGRLRDTPPGPGRWGRRSVRRHERAEGRAVHGWIDAVVPLVEPTGAEPRPERPGHKPSAIEAAETLRVVRLVVFWRSTLAGPDTGTVFVAIEHKNMAALAEAQTKLSKDPEWQSFIKDMEKSGLRTVQSNSLLEEITP